MNAFIIQGMFLALSVPAGANRTGDERFSEAQTVFDEAKAALAVPGGDGVATRRKFYDAALQFAEIANEGVHSAHLFVNAGNAFHFAGDNARALLWYLRANRLANTVDIRNGVLALRKACGAEPWPHENGSIGRALLFWHYDLSRPFKHWTLLATYPLGCLLVTVGCFAERRSVSIRFGVALMVIGATMGVSDLVAAAGAHRPWAVVLQDSKGYAGDGEGYSIIANHITPGQEVRIIESRKQWTHVELPSGNTCWLPASVCEKA